MLWRTHFFAGTTAGLMLTASNPDIKTIAISAGITGVSALLPDLDSPNSKLGRLVPIIPSVLSVTVGHRGALHSFLGALGVSLAVTMLVKMWYACTFLELFLLILVGYMTHLLLDSLTNSGCPLFWPIKIRIRLPILNTGGLIERLIVLPAMIILFIWFSIPLVCNHLNIQW